MTSVVQLGSYGINEHASADTQNYYCKLRGGNTNKHTRLNMVKWLHQTRQNNAS